MKKKSKFIKLLIYLVTTILIMYIFIINIANADTVSKKMLFNKKCKTPELYDRKLELEKLSPRRSLTRDEKIDKGYITTGGVIKQQQIGDVESFWIIDGADWVTVDAKLSAINEHAYIYVQEQDRLGNKVLFDSASNQGYITQLDINNIANRFFNTGFSDNIYETTRETFGVEPPAGLDDDTRVTILLLDIDSDYANYIESGYEWWNNAWIAGYYFSADTFTDNDIYPPYHSNERKIIYIDTYPSFEHGYFDIQNGNEIYNFNPEPTIDHSNDIDTDDITMPEGPEAAYSLLSHEFQHMIHYYKDNDEEVWLDEGCSGLSEFINDNVHPFAVDFFIDDPTDSLVDWGYDIADYGNSYLFMLYLYEHFGGAAAIQNLVAESANGTASVTQMLLAMNE